MFCQECQMILLLDNSARFLQMSTLFTFGMNVSSFPLRHILRYNFDDIGPSRRLLSTFDEKKYYQIR